MQRFAFQGCRKAHPNPLQLSSPRPSLLLVPPKIFNPPQQHSSQQHEQHEHFAFLFTHLHARGPYRSLLSVLPVTRVWGVLDSMAGESWEYCIDCSWCGGWWVVGEDIVVGRKVLSYVLDGMKELFAKGCSASKRGCTGLRGNAGNLNSHTVRQLRCLTGCRAL